MSRACRLPAAGQHHRRGIFSIPTFSLTLRCEVFGLCVEHQVDAREGRIPQQRGREPTEHATDPFGLIDILQGSIHTPIAKSSTLQGQTKVSHPCARHRLRSPTHTPRIYNNI